MKFSALDYAQRELNYAIVDEVDSILIDEARTPLIISGQGEPSSHKYRQINEVIPRLRKDEHYVVDEKAHSVTLTDDGVDARAEADGDRQPLRPDQPRVAPHPEPVPARALALQARRELPGRRRRQGPHHRRVHRPRPPRAALERRPPPGGRGEGERAHPGRDPHDGDHHVPEPLPPLQEALRHDRHGRHRGRGVPRDLQARRHRHPDEQADGPRRTTRTSSTRPSARSSPRVVGEILEYHEKGQPVLVGTTSVEKSEAIAQHPQEEEDPARGPQREAAREGGVRRRAGRAQRAPSPSRTNMAGRGTDIILGGNPEMLAKLEFKEQGRDPDDGARGVRRGRREVRQRPARPRAKRCESSAASTSSAPSGTSRAASTTSSAAAPAARATRARAASTCRSKTT